MFASIIRVFCHTSFHTQTTKNNTYNLCHKSTMVHRHQVCLQSLLASKTLIVLSETHHVMLLACMRRYGVKMEALALLQEWIQSVGSAAGLNAENTSLTSGAVGVPESRLEVGGCNYVNCMSKRGHSQ